MYSAAAETEDSAALHEDRNFKRDFGQVRELGIL